MATEKVIVYKHITPSGKVYIGQTCSTKNRWKSKGINYRKSTYFYNAIQKYGWDNIQHIIVTDNLTKKEANWLENYLIMYYESYNRDKGYNLTLGGDSGPTTPWNKGKTLSDEHKKHLSEAHKGKTSGMKGRHHTDTAKKKISETRKGRKQSESWRSKQKKWVKRSITLLNPYNNHILYFSSRKRLADFFWSYVL